MQRKFSEMSKSWPVMRLLRMSCIGRSLAMLMLLPSATGNASRRNLFWPDEVARPVCATPASNFLSPRPSAISENRKRSDGSSRARSASDEIRAGWATIFSWARPLSALTVLSDLTTSK